MRERDEKEGITSRLIHELFLYLLPFISSSSLAICVDFMLWSMCLKNQLKQSYFFEMLLSKIGWERIICFRFNNKIYCFRKHFRVFIVVKSISLHERHIFHVSTLSIFTLYIDVLQTCKRASLFIIQSVIFYEKAHAYMWCWLVGIGE